MAKAKRASVGRRSKFRLEGGPFHGQVIELYSGGTLGFTASGQTGRYKGQGETLHWEEKK
jgi:hypothetical protein